jgi:hypothetical protein
LAVSRGAGFAHDAMKNLTLTAAGVMLLALLISLLFRALYPGVEMTSELAGLFVFVAVVLKLIGSTLWSLRRKPAAPAEPAAKP